MTNSIESTQRLSKHPNSLRSRISCTDKPRVAFVCTHNACRSQIAEALGKLLASNVFESYSAGVMPADAIDPMAQRILFESHRIDMKANGQRSKLVSEIPDPDVLVLMGCEVSCPHLPNKHLEDWGIADPIGKSEEAYIEIIDDIERKVISLSEKLSCRPS